MQNLSEKKLKLPNALANSLPVRAFFAVAITIVLAIITPVSSAILAWSAQSDAKAINTAGSIRMATYRISYLMASDYKNSQYLDQNFHLSPNQPLTKQLASDMENRLTDLYHYEQSRRNQNKDIIRQIDALEQTWRQRLKPLLLANNTQQFFIDATAYINHVDELAQHIEERNEQRQIYQQTLQICSLVIMLIVMLVGLSEMRQKVLLPVLKLRHATHRFRKGEYSPVMIDGYEEFNELGKSFNKMASSLKSYQDNLEAEVARKTFHLTQSNQALTLLYDFAKELSSQTISYPKLQVFIKDFAKVMPHLHLKLCFHNNLFETKDVVALDSDAKISLMGNFCQTANCDVCEIKQQDKAWVFPIQSQQIEWGEIIVTPKWGVTEPTQRHFQLDDSRSNSHTNLHKISLTQMPDNEQPSFDETELLNTLASLIAIVFSNQRQREQQHKLILFEERNTIARELHDSLAQSLSYLKMQMALLANLLKQDHTSEEQQHRIDQVMLQSKEGLNDAYSQLRELLVTFRLKIEEGEFDDALQQACDEFANKGGFVIHLDNRLNSNNLTANEQVDLLQISREALSNINRHASAEHVHISLTQGQQGSVTLRVQDNGVGLDKNFDHRQHHGLKIMQERSNNLGGEFRIENVLPHGTAILVKFMPKSFASMK